MTGSILVRPGRINDLGALVRFNKAMALETEGKELDDAVVTQGVESVLGAKGCGLYFVAEVEGKVVGQTMVTLEWSDWRNGFFWWIQSVYVSPEYRRGGVFRALHAFVRDAARQDGGACGLRLYVHHGNERAMAAYRRLGMTQTEYRLFEEDWSSC